MSKRVSVYSGYWSNSIPNAGTISTSFVIRAPQRSLKLLSITVDLQLWKTATGIRLPNATQTTQLFKLSIAAPVNSKMARMFTTTGGTPLTNDGDFIIISKEGQLKFDSFFFTNEMVFTLVAINNEAADAVTHDLSVMVEVEEEIIR